MANVAYQISQERPNDVEIVVHIDEELGASLRGELVEFLTSTDGINVAEFCPLRYHLMLVQYDREKIRSQEVLHRVNSHNVHAELVGPI